VCRQAKDGIPVIMKQSGETIGRLRRDPGRQPMAATALELAPGKSAHLCDTFIRQQLRRSHQHPALLRLKLHRQDEQCREGGRITSIEIQHRNQGSI